MCDGRTRIRCYTYFNRWGVQWALKKISNILLYNLDISVYNNFFYHKGEKSMLKFFFLRIPRAPLAPLRLKKHFKICLCIKCIVFQFFFDWNGAKGTLGAKKIFQKNIDFLFYFVLSNCAIFFPDFWLPWRSQEDPDWAGPPMFKWGFGR